jgi:hypothetical protein
MQPLGLCRSCVGPWHSEQDAKEGDSPDRHQTGDAMSWGRAIH